MANIIPGEALAFLRNKRLRVGFSYKDVWRDEHATPLRPACLRGRFLLCNNTVHLEGGKNVIFKLVDWPGEAGHEGN